jgi:hypothetical protein
MAPSRLGTEELELLGILRKKIDCEDDMWVVSWGNKDNSS